MAREINYKQNNGGKFVSEKFVKPLSKMLDMENASTSIIKHGVDHIEELVKNNCDVKTHQIRRLYTIIKGIDDIKKLNFERPHVKYIGSGQRSRHGKNIVEVIDKLIDVITQEKKEEYIKGLQYIMESIVAYHRFYVKEK